MLNSMGSAVAARVAVIALSLADWRSAFLPATAGIDTVALAMHAFSRERYVVQRVDLGLGPPFCTLFRNRQTL